MFLSLRVACGSTIQFKYILSYFSMSRASPNVFGYLRLEYPYVYFVFLLLFIIMSVGKRKLIDDSLCNERRGFFL